MNPTISRLQVAPHKTTTLWAACAITYLLRVLSPLSTVPTLFEESIATPGLIDSAGRLCNWRVKNARGIYFIRSQFPGHQREKLDNMFHMTICRSWRICDHSSIRQRSIANLHISTVTRSKCKRHSWKKCFYFYFYLVLYLMSSLETLSFGIKSSLPIFYPASGEFEHSECLIFIFWSRNRVLDNLKDYSVKALVNAVDHLGTVAYKLNDLLSQQTSEISTTELRAASLAQVYLLLHVYSTRKTSQLLTSDVCLGECLFCWYLTYTDRCVRLV
jgi:hypothetical protein